VRVCGLDVCAACSTALEENNALGTLCECRQGIAISWRGAVFVCSACAAKPVAK
jgi:hypothetical protein